METILSQPPPLRVNKGCIAFEAAYVNGGQNFTVEAAVPLPFKPLRLVLPRGLSSHFIILGLDMVDGDGKIVSCFLSPSAIHGSFFDQEATPIAMAFKPANVGYKFVMKVCSASGQPLTFNAVLEGIYVP